MAKSGYVLAGIETLHTIIHNFILNKKNRYQDNFSRTDISKFLFNTCSGFLHSYGASFGGKKTYSKYNKSEAKLFQTCRNSGLFDNSTFIADSGGFQISVGRLNRKESKLLLTLYYEFLEQYHHVLDRAFILDVPPGPNCEIFHSFTDVYNLNLQSYLTAAALPDEVKQKIIYIHHFRTPKLWDIYTKILRDNDLFPQFQYHGTGGIVANMSGDMAIPCIIYVVPMIPLINEAIKHKRDYLNFHILGGANFRDILFYELFQIHVQKKHNLKLNITYDSSGLFKGLMIGRFIQIFDGTSFRKTDLKSNALHKRFTPVQTVADVFINELNNLANKYNFRNIPMGQIYDNTTGTFFEDAKVYAMLYMLDQFAVVQNMMKDVAKKVYPIYESNNIELFTNHMINTTKMLNSGKITRKQKAKSNSVVKSLDMLSSLDEEYCKHIVTKFLSKDEFINLDHRKRLGTI